jgi:hypothetical protein
LFERDRMLLWEFKTYCLDRHVAYMIVSLAVIALGEERPTRHVATLDVFAAPRAEIELWLRRELRVGPKMAATIVRAALGASSSYSSPPELRRVAGRLEMHVRNPQWPDGLRAVE